MVRRRGGDRCEELRRCIPIDDLGSVLVDSHASVEIQLKKLDLNGFGGQAVEPVEIERMQALDDSKIGLPNLLEF